MKAQGGGGRDGGRCSIWWRGRDEEDVPFGGERDQEDIPFGGARDDEDVPFGGGRDEEDVPFGGGEGCGRCSICHIPIEPDLHF